MTPRHGVMVSTAAPDGTVTSRLWLVPPFVADTVAALLGPADMEQLQTQEQARAGAAAGAGIVTYRQAAPGAPPDGAP